MIAPYIKNIMRNMICVTGMYSREIITMFLVGQVLGLVENFNIGICSDTINVVNVKLCMMVLLIEHYLFKPLSVTLTIFSVHSSVEQLFF